MTAVDLQPVCARHGWGVPLLRSDGETETTWWCPMPDCPTSATIPVGGRLTLWDGAIPVTGKLRV